MIDTEDGPAMLLHSGMLRVHEAVYRDDTWLFYMDGWKWQLYNTFGGMHHASSASAPPLVVLALVDLISTQSYFSLMV